MGQRERGFYQTIYFFAKQQQNPSTKQLKILLITYSYPVMAEDRESATVPHLEPNNSITYSNPVIADDELASFLGHSEINHSITYPSSVIFEEGLAPLFGQLKLNESNQVNYPNPVVVDDELLELKDTDQVNCSNPNDICLEQLELNNSVSCSISDEISLEHMVLNGSNQKSDRAKIQTTIITMLVPGGCLLAFDRRSRTYLDGFLESVEIVPKSTKWQALRPSLHVLNAGDTDLLGACREQMISLVGTFKLIGHVPTVEQVATYLVDAFESKQFEEFEWDIGSIIVVGVEKGEICISVVRKGLVKKNGNLVSDVSSRLSDRPFECLGKGSQFALPVLNGFAGGDYESCVKCVKDAMLAACNCESTGEKVHIIFLKNEGTFKEIFARSVLIENKVPKFSDASSDEEDPPDSDSESSEEEVLQPGDSDSDIDEEEQSLIRQRFGNV